MSDIVERIKREILHGSQDLFDNDSVEDLRVTLRIAHDFNVFLEKFADDPPVGEIVYVSDTVRSGMEEFISLAHTCAVINVDDDNWRFAPHLNWNYRALRKAFMDGFRRLSESHDSGADQKLSWLLALTHLELVFLARYFPSAILVDVSASARKA